MTNEVPGVKDENHRYVNLGDVAWDKDSLPCEDVEAPKSWQSKEDAVALHLCVGDAKEKVELIDNEFSAVKVAEEPLRPIEKFEDDFFYKRITRFCDAELVIDIPEGFLSSKVIRLSQFFDLRTQNYAFALRIRLGRGAQAAFHFDLESSDYVNASKKPFLFSLAVEQAEESHLKLFQLQNLSAETVFAFRQHFTLARNAVARVHTFHDGAAKGQHRSHGLCAGEGADFGVHYGVRADRDQRIDLWSVAEHPVKHTTSDTSAWNVLKDDALVCFNGNIVITPEGAKTLAYQSNKNLILSDKAQVHTLPKLEIATDDVKCSHGASTATLDKTQLFYLQSRGISKDEAERMLIDGFTRPILSEIPLDNLRKEYLPAGEGEVV